MFARLIFRLGSTAYLFLDRRCGSSSDEVEVQLSILSAREVLLCGISEGRLIGRFCDGSSDDAEFSFPVLSVLLLIRRRVDAYRLIGRGCDGSSDVWHCIIGRSGLSFGLSKRLMRFGVASLRRDVLRGIIDWRKFIGVGVGCCWKLLCLLRTVLSRVGV